MDEMHNVITEFVDQQCDSANISWIHRMSASISGEHLTEMHSWVQVGNKSNRHSCVELRSRAAKFSKNGAGAQAEPNWKGVLQINGPESLTYSPP